MIQLVFFQNLRVQWRNAIDAESVVDIDMRHVHNIVPVDDRHTLVLIFSADFIIQYFDDRH